MVILVQSSNINSNTKRTTVERKQRKGLSAKAKMLGDIIFLEISWRYAIPPHYICNTNNMMYYTVYYYAIKNP